MSSKMIKAGRWPKSKPLTLPPHGSLLSDATDEEYLSVAEDLIRDQLKRKIFNAVIAGKVTKKQAWDQLIRDEGKDPVFLADMAARLQKAFGTDKKEEAA